MPEAPKLCPILTAAVIKPAEEKSLIATPMGAPTTGRPESDAAACVGPACAWYVPIAGPDGKVSGACAPTLLPAAIGQLTQVGATILSNYELRRKH